MIPFVVAFVLFFCFLVGLALWLQHLGSERD